MANNQYFTNFPVITYSNTNIRDLSRHVVIKDEIINSPNSLYAYDLENAQRSDVLAYNYYGDSYWDWILLLSNGIVDPYSGWYLRQEDFNAYIVNTYGSYELAQSQVYYWATNWSEDDLTYAPNYYNRLPVSQQKYFVPVWGASSIIGYKRNPVDWFTNINMMIEVVVSNNQQFTANTLVQTTNNENFVGTAVVSAVLDDGVTLQLNQVQGNVNSTCLLQLWQAGSILDANAVPISSVKTLQINIPNDELVYWDSVTYFEYESELNEQRKSLIVMNPSYVSQTQQSLNTLLNT